VLCIAFVAFQIVIITLILNSLKMLEYHVSLVSHSRSCMWQPVICDVTDAWELNYVNGNFTVFVKEHCTGIENGICGLWQTLATCIC